MIMEGNFKMIAKTFFGFEPILAKELRDLGAMDVKEGNRMVSFVGDKGFMYKANLNLRTALRILKPIAHFQAHDEKELYKNNALVIPYYLGISKRCKFICASGCSCRVSARRRASAT